MRTSRLVLTFVLLFPLQTIFALNSAQEYNQKIEATWGSDEANACKLAKEGAGKYPGNAELIGRQGYCMKKLQIGDYGIQLLEKAYRMDQSNSSILVWIEDAYLAYGWKCSDVPDKAAALWKRAMEINPSNTEYLYQIGNLYSNSKTPEKAIEWLTKAIEKGRNDSSVYAARGNAYKNMDQFDLSKKDLDQALKINPNDAWALYIYAYLALNLKQPETAAQMDERFLALKDSDFSKQQSINVKSQLASLYTGLGEFDKAKQIYQDLIQKHGNDDRKSNWENALYFISDRLVRVKYEVKAEKAQLQVLLPTECSYQKIARVKIEPEPLQKKVQKLNGNTYVELKFSKAPGSVKVAVDLILSQATYQKQGFLFRDPGDNPMDHLGNMTDSNVEINPKDPELKNLVKSIIGSETNPYLKATLIHQWMMKNFTYKIVFPSSIREYLATKSGECGGYALVFTALARTAGLPARRVFSPLLEVPDEKTFGSHMTSEFYIDQKGWCPVNNTDNVFASTSNVISLWRKLPQKDYNLVFTVPDLKSISVEYIKLGKKRILKGG